MFETLTGRLNQIFDGLRRRGKLSGDIQALSSMVAAAVRADNLRRQAAGQRVRFRFTGGHYFHYSYSFRNIVTPDGHGACDDGKASPCSLGKPEEPP